MVKPNTEIFELTLQKLKVSSSEAIFIDDNKKHVQAAEKLGIKGLQFTSANNLRKQLLNLKLMLDQ